MLRLLLSGLCVLVLAAGALRADDVRAKIKSVDADKSTVTVTVDDKDQTFSVAKDAKITHLVGKKPKKATSEDLPGGLSGLSEGNDVTLSTDKKDGKDVVTAIKVEGLTAKKKKKNK